MVTANICSSASHCLISLTSLYLDSVELALFLNASSLFCSSAKIACCIFCSFAIKGERSLWSASSSKTVSLICGTSAFCTGEELFCGCLALSFSISGERSLRAFWTISKLVAFFIDETKNSISESSWLYSVGANEILAPPSVFAGLG